MTQHFTECFQVCIPWQLQRRVSIRAAKEAGAEAYYLFMGDEKNRALEITATGWRVLDRYPVTFGSRQHRPRSLSQSVVAALMNIVNIV